MSDSNSIIVREYLSSLKEDKELDYLFPILLSVMGFRIIQTAKESKGQSQYGKDVIAVGKDENGESFRWYFELKGFKDKDINDKNFFSSDGIRESILEAKYTAYDDSSISEFNKLPIKIVIVHNGVIKANIRPTFEGFINKEFEVGEFERWDIYHLTDLFSKFLFSEYLLSDEKSNRLFKRTLAFLDAPDNNFDDFKQLVEIQFKKVTSVKGRAFKKLFATLNLLSSIVFHYSKANSNLISAKECVSFLILKTWAWILKNNFEKKRGVLREFNKLLNIQYEVLFEYFKKTLPVANIKNGLYAEDGIFFEIIGYPLRCFDYIGDLIYYYYLQHYIIPSSSESKHTNEIRNAQKDEIISLIGNNSGFLRPIIDNHSIPILQTFLFFANNSDIRKKDVDFIAAYIFGVIEGIIIIKTQRQRLPEGSSRIELVSEFASTGNKPEEYIDDSSMLIALLFELLVLFDTEDMYKTLKHHLDENISLQIAHPNFKEYDIEQLMFEKHMNNEYYIDSEFTLPNDFNEFKKSIKAKEYDTIEYRTDEAGFPFLRTLAHTYFKNELFPNEWREKIATENKEV